MLEVPSPKNFGNETIGVFDNPQTLLSKHSLIEQIDVAKS